MGTEITTRTVGMGIGALLVALLALTPAVLANLPLGACCFPNGACQDVQSTQCDGLNGEFIGEGTSCREIDCNGALAAPVLSIVGLVAMLGALGGLGVYCLAIRRRDV